MTGTQLQLITVSEVGRYQSLTAFRTELGVSRTTAWRWEKAGYLVTVILRGGRKFVDRYLTRLPIISSAHA